MGSGTQGEAPEAGVYFWLQSKGGRAGQQLGELKPQEGVLQTKAGEREEDRHPGVVGAGGTGQEEHTGRERLCFLEASLGREVVGRAVHRPGRGDAFGASCFLARDGITSSLIIRGQARRGGIWRRTWHGGEEGGGRLRGKPDAQAGSRGPVGGGTPGPCCCLPVLSRGTSRCHKSL